MKVYKEKQFLIFDFEDGKTVKYDFAKKQAIGKSGKPVNDLKRQLQGMTINQLIDCCEDENYAKFLNFVKRNCNGNISNIGTILEHTCDYSNYEQLFSAGLTNFNPWNMKCNISDIPKSLIKVAKDREIRLDNKIIKYWKENPDGYYLAYQLQYNSLNDADIFTILTRDTSTYIENGRYIYSSYFNILINEYGYNAKSLLLYIDELKTFEAIDRIFYLLDELYDYARMMKEISGKFDRYPRHFLTTHKIACRNYNRFKQEFSEEMFKTKIDKDYEFTYKDYKFIYPNCVQDIKDEAVSQNNCVASYIDSVIEGHCHILFLRKKDSLDKSLVTIEVRNDRIVQAKRKFNDPVTPEDQKAIDAWNKKFSKQ